MDLDVSKTALDLRADKIIRNYVIACMAASLVPWPLLVDVAAIIAIEVRMITELAEVYAVPFPKRLVIYKALASLAGGIGPAYFSVKFSSLIRGLPLAGYGVYLALLSLTGGASVFAVGKIFQEHFESGGTFLNDKAAVRRYFGEKLEEGKKLVPFLVPTGSAAKCA